MKKKPNPDWAPAGHGGPEFDITLNDGGKMTLAVLGGAFKIGRAKVGRDFVVLCPYTCPGDLHKARRNFIYNPHPVYIAVTTTAKDWDAFIPDAKRAIKAAAEIGLFNIKSIKVVK